MEFGLIVASDHTQLHVKKDLVLQYQKLRAILGYRRGLNETFAVLGFYAA
jgi:hypothetical protein